MWKAIFYLSSIVCGAAIAGVAWQFTTHPLLRVLAVVLALGFAGVLWFVH